jgi:hypothetical protein
VNFYLHCFVCGLRLLLVLQPLSATAFRTKRCFFNFGVRDKCSHARLFPEAIPFDANMNEPTQLRDWLLPILMNGQVTVG